MLLSIYQAKPLLARREKLGHARSSEDLNLNKIDVEIEEGGVRFPSVFVPWATLIEIAQEERRVFSIGDAGEATAVHVFSEATGWVRSLCPSESAPTVLVSGIPMHRVKDTDPMRDTRAKMQALGVQKGRVLDTATGLGYTAIAAGRTAKEVVTIELDPAAIELARQNPWSQDLFRRDNITQIIGDALEEVPKLSAGTFGAIIHDPPTMALGGDLYSVDFYRQLRRVLNKGGKLFHYISDPDSPLGKKQWPGVIRRLRENGFDRVERHPEAYGITAIAN